MLLIKNLVVSIENKDVLKGVDLTIKPGEIHALMGPNGAGKTSLALSLMGHPNYKIKNQPFDSAQGKKSDLKYQINGKDMKKLKPEQRARQGLFVAFQQPIEVTGVSVLSFLRTAHKALYPKDKTPLSLFKQIVRDSLLKVGLDETFMTRFLNEGFSGGEKKRLEVAQLLILRPKFAVLDEIDSGLDIDSLKIIAKVLKKIAKEEKVGMLLITHYQRILHTIKPDKVHVLIDGKIVATDGIKLVGRIERKGYADFS